MSTTTRPLTGIEDAHIQDATYHLRAALRRMRLAQAECNREGVLVEARSLQRLAKAIEQGLAE